MAKYSKSKRRKIFGISITRGFCKHLFGVSAELDTFFNS